MKLRRSSTRRSKRSAKFRQLQDDVLERAVERREGLEEFLAEQEILAEELQIVVEAINDEIMGMNEVALDLIEDVETQIKETEASATICISSFQAGQCYRWQVDPRHRGKHLASLKNLITRWMCSWTM